MIDLLSFAPPLLALLPLGGGAGALVGAGAADLRWFRVFRCGGRTVWDSDWSWLSVRGGKGEGTLTLAAVCGTLLAEPL